MLNPQCSGWGLRYNGDDGVSIMHIIHVIGDNADSRDNGDNENLI